MTEPAWLEVLAFLIENMGVMVIGDDPVIEAADTFSFAFFPKVLRSRTFLSVLPPRDVGAIVGMVAETWGSTTGSICVSAFLFSVLKSRTSAALAE